MTTTAQSPGRRRAAADRCPGAVELHEAQDGLLARVRLPGGRLSPGALAALAALAELGNGLVDLTARGNLQLRGLHAADAAMLATGLRAAGLLPSLEHDRVRNVLASPVAGRHPRALADTDAVVDAIDRGLCRSSALAGLPGRFLFAVDDGSGLALGRLADVALLARGAQRYALALGGHLTELELAAERAPAAALAAAQAFLEQRVAGAGDPAWRIAELAGGPAAIAARLGTRLAPAPPPAPSRLGTGLAPAPPPVAARLALGRLTQRDERVALTALAPLGRLEAPVLRGLADLGRELRLSTDRTVTICDVERGAVPALERALAGLGLVLSPLSGWVGLTACAGLGRCPKARVDVRAAAALRARARGAAAGAEHWSACERRCGEHPDQAVAVAAHEHAVVVTRGGAVRELATVAEAVEALA